MSRTRRQHILRKLLAESPVSTQQELVQGLQSHGFSVTQATVSRDLAALGAVRGPNGYSMPEHFAAMNANQPPQDTRLVPVLREHALVITAAASLVVIRTAPGHANFVASEIDASRPEGMVGCLAGDDTIFIATQSDKAAAGIARIFNAIIQGGAA